MHPVLLDLFERFEILYPLPESPSNDRVYLIPDLLPPERPDLSILWPDSDEKHTAYRRYDCDSIILSVKKQRERERVRAQGRRSPELAKQKREREMSVGCGERERERERMRGDRETERERGKMLLLTLSLSLRLRRYEVDFVPTGFLSRTLIRVAQLARVHSYWKNGTANENRGRRKEVEKRLGGERLGSGSQSEAERGVREGLSHV